MRSEIQSLLHDDLGIPVGSPHLCPYLEDRFARERAFYAERLPSVFYQSLMDHGWRRSGNIVYKPSCSGCSECVPIRVPVEEFTPNRTQRKIARRNHDLTVSVAPCAPTEEKFDLFLRYQNARHSGKMCTQWHEFASFLYVSPIQTLEFEFRLDGKLAAVAIVDAGSHYLSAVYNYFDPELDSRSLGTNTILWSIEYAKAECLQFYYMGYMVGECRKMNYKRNFHPYELGDGRGNWTRFD